MPSSILILIGSTGVGCGLALLSIFSGLPVGWVGAVGLICWTLIMRKRWLNVAARTGLEPGAPERVLRFHAVGIALLFGHSVSLYAFPEIDFHFGQGNYLAIDSWTMIVGMLIASRIIRPDRKIQDERDAAITARGTRTGYIALIFLFVVFSILLGVLPPRYIPTLSYFVIGNMQITIILASLLVKFSVQLFAYAKDTNADFAPNEWDESE